MNPLISIIVPVYNVEGYIERCLLSLIAQTYTNLEIIIVNDGSVDRSIEIAEASVVKDKRVKIIDQPNLGIGEARNTGIRHSIGDFVTFVDSDDWIDERMIELLVYSALHNNAEISCCGFNQIVKDKTYPFFLDLELDKKINYLGLCFNEVYNDREKIVTTAWGKLFSLALLKQNGILFSLPNFEDSPFFIKAVYYSNKISFVRDPLYTYIYRDDSITNSPISETKINCFYKADNLILEFLKEKGLYDTYKIQFDSFHFLRIIHYGGCRRLYWENQTYGTVYEYLIFFKYLKSQKGFLKQLKPSNLGSFEVKVLKVLKIGLFFERINGKLPNIFFKVVGRILQYYSK